MNQHTSIQLSRFLEEKGFDKEDYISQPDFENGGIVKTYDLLWDICILHGKELFGEDGEVGEYCRKPENKDGTHCNDRDCEIRNSVWHEGQETISHIIFKLVLEGEIEKAESEIKINCIL